MGDRGGGGSSWLGCRPDSMVLAASAVGGGHQLAGVLPCRPHSTLLPSDTGLVSGSIRSIHGKLRRTGTAGGIFAPLLVLGALIGLGIGEATHHFFPLLVPIPAIFAVVRHWPHTLRPLCGLR